MIITHGNVYAIVGITKNVSLNLLKRAWRTSVSTTLISSVSTKILCQSYLLTWCDLWPKVPPSLATATRLWRQALGYDIFSQPSDLETLPTVPDGAEYALPKNPDGSVKFSDKVKNFNQTWTEIEKLLESGKVKSIGVSNFSAKTLAFFLSVHRNLSWKHLLDLNNYSRPQKSFR